MGSLRLLLSASAIFAAVQTSCGSASLGCTWRELAQCMYPMTYQKMMHNLDYPFEATFNEVCSKVKTCMDAYVSSCLDKEAQEFYSEGSDAFVLARKQICGMTPLTDDITRHLHCWSAPRVKEATEGCKKVKRLASIFSTAMWPGNARDLPMIWALQTIPERVEKFTESVCVMAKVAVRCTWPLVKDCSLDSKDCLPGYLVQSMNEYSTLHSD